MYIYIYDVYTYIYIYIYIHIYIYIYLFPHVCSSPEECLLTNTGIIFIIIISIISIAIESAKHQTNYSRFASNRLIIKYSQIEPNRTDKIKFRNRNESISSRTAG